MARDRFLTNATDDLPETGTKRHAPTIQDLYLMPNQGAEAVISGSRDGRAWEQRRSRLRAEAVAPGSRDGRAWEQRRSRLGAETVTPEARPLERGATFADKSYLY